MASNLIKPDTCPVTLPGAFPPMPAVARILSRHNRSNLAAFVTVAIDLLDVLDGDPDREGECSEDEISRCTDLGRPVRGNGPGCDIADTGENAWIEWHTMRGSQKRGPNITQSHEDAEDDDPAEDDDHAGGAIDDEPHDPEGDFDTNERIFGGGSGM